MNFKFKTKLFKPKLTTKGLTTNCFWKTKSCQLKVAVIKIRATSGGFIFGKLVALDIDIDLHLRIGAISSQA